MAEELAGEDDADRENEDCGRAGGMDGLDLHTFMQPAGRRRVMKKWKLSKNDDQILKGDANNYGNAQYRREC